MQSDTGIYSGKDMRDLCKLVNQILDTEADSTLLGRKSERSTWRRHWKRKLFSYALGWSPAGETVAVLKLL